MNTQLIKTYINFKGGVNNMPIVHVMSGFLQLQSFSGKTAELRAKRWQKSFHKGLTPNNL